MEEHHHLTNEDIVANKNHPYQERSGVFSCRGGWCRRGAFTASRRMGVLLFTLVLFALLYSTSRRAGESGAVTPSSTFSHDDDDAGDNLDDDDAVVMEDEITKSKDQETSMIISQLNGDDDDDEEDTEEITENLPEPTNNHRTGGGGYRPPSKTTNFTQVTSGNVGYDDNPEEALEEDCSAAVVEKLRVEDPEEYEIRAADCGLGYDFRNSTARYKSQKVLLYGPSWSGLIWLSGCPNGGSPRSSCPLSPRCRISIASRAAELKTADVAVLTVFDTDLVDKISARVTKVLYWREAYWPGISVGKQRAFDFEMGIHHFAGIVNPNYLRRPKQLTSHSLVPFLPFAERPHFALSIISDCHASSQRNTYVDHLSDYLGSARVHQYGDCGNRKLPPPPMTNAAKVIAKYKFYLAFENTIQDGYITEKLMTVLNMPIVPVYMGAPDAPNVTRPEFKAYINVLDFPSPRDLAEYLLFLDRNPEEYMKYHAWRKHPHSAFDPAYLKLVQAQVPGKEEDHIYRSHHFDRFPRRAACCRLCDEHLVGPTRAKGKHRKFVEHKWGVEQINKRLFAGKMNSRPGKNAKLD